MFPHWWMAFNGTKTKNLRWSVVVVGSIRRRPGTWQAAQKKNHMTIETNPHANVKHVKGIRNTMVPTMTAA